MAACSVVDCARPLVARGFCRPHYAQEWAKAGNEWRKRAKVNDGVCAVDNCQKPAATRGWCFMHYQRWRVHGDVASVRVVPPNCTKCGAEKYRNASGKIYCRPCAARIRKDHAERNADKIRAAKSAYYEANKDAINERNKSNYLKNSQAYAVSTRAWREANRELVLGYKKKWSAANLEKGREYAARRRALYLEALCEHGPDCVDAQVFRGIQEKSCTYCGAPAEHADHFIPLTRGGLHCRDNIVPACPRCNLSKNNHMPDDWIQSISG